MKKLFFKSVLLLLPFINLQAQIFQDEDAAPKDQFMAIFGTSVYALYKVLDFANDHGFRYIKILSYEFTGFDHTVTGTCNNADQNQGRFFKLTDDFLTISFLCFEEAPNDRYIIDLEEYRSLIDEIEDGIEDFYKSSGGFIK